MSDKMRWRYGDTNPVVAAVDSATVIKIGNLLWLDEHHAKPASAIRIHASERRPDPTSTIPGATAGPMREEVFADKFLGVAMQRSMAGDTTPIRVSTTGVFEFDCPSGTFELGDLVGVDEGEMGSSLLDHQISRARDQTHAIARVARREPFAVNSVNIDIRSTVMTGGIVGRPE